MRKEDSQYQIGELARKSGLSVHAVRYYEARKLMDKASRTSGGFRVYGSLDLERLLFIRQAQSLGLSLEEIRCVLPCGSKTLEPCCSLAVSLFERKITEFEKKIRELQVLKKQIRRLLAGQKPPQRTRSQKR